MARGRLYVGWESLKVKEYVDVVRCFKCQGIGHIGMVCRDEEQTCGRCAEKHKTENCRVNDENVKCCNCLKEGRKERHPATWLRCEVYRRAEERYLKSVNYES